MIRNLSLTLCLVLLAACNLPLETNPTQNPATAIGTPAAGTKTLPPIPPATDTPSATPPSAGTGLEDLPNTTILYYDILGSSESELRAQLDTLGPVDDSGFKGDAITNWTIYWNWPGYGNSSCTLSQATIRYEIEVIFPRWKAPESTSSALIAKWINYTQVLSVHEKGHIDIVAANYQSVLEAIQGATCDTADAAATAAVEPIRQLQHEYDEVTGHGLTQGARFP